jgi:hypothetical protein
MGRYWWNYARLYASPDGWRMVKQMMSDVPALRDRRHDMDRDLKYLLDKAHGQVGILPWLTYHGGTAVALGDLSSALPTYYTAYQKYLLQGIDEEDAKYMAQKDMRNAHGSGGLVDLAPLQRGGAWAKLMTVAWGFWDHNYNRLRSIGREARLLLTGREPQRLLGYNQQQQRKITALRRFLALMRIGWKAAIYLPIVGMFTHMLQTGFYSDEEQETTDALIEHLSAGTVEELLGLPPGARAMSYPVAELTAELIHDPNRLKPLRDPMADPLTQILSTGMKATWHGLEYALGMETRRLPLNEIVTLLGYLMSIPGAGQAGATSQYWADVYMGLQRADTTGEMIWGTAFGKSHPEEPIKLPRKRRLRR